MLVLACLVPAAQADVSNSSDSEATSFTVSKADATVRIDSVTPSGPITLGTSVVVSASVSVFGRVGVVPTGLVTVSDGSHRAGDSCIARLPAAAPFTINCTLTPTTAGEHALTASYSGDSNFVGDYSAPSPLSVTSSTHLVTAVANGYGNAAPASQYIADGDTAHIAVVPSAGYAVTAFGGTCPAGILSGNIYATGPITADCSVTMTFVKATLHLTVTDKGDYARYGSVLTYEITLSNSNGTDVSGLSINATALAGLDLNHGQWQCLGSHCTASGSGPFADTGVTVPAGQSVTWVVAIPVLQDTSSPTIDYTVSVIGAGAVAPQTDSDILVDFRDGFDAPNLDGPPPYIGPPPYTGIR